MRRWFCSIVVDSLFIVAPMFCGDFVRPWSIVNGEERAGCFARLSFWCLRIVVWLFLTMPWVCLQFVIVVFPDHTHLQFLTFLVLQSSHWGKESCLLYFGFLLEVMWLLVFCGSSSLIVSLNGHNHTFEQDGSF